MLPLIASVVEGLHWLRGVERARCPHHVINGFVSQVATPVPSHTHTLPPSDAAGMTADPFTDIRTWCRQYDPLEVIGQYVPLTAWGSGCCPFGWHHDDGIDSHASFYVYRPTFPAVRCWYCHTWKQGGSLFDFFRYYYDLSPRELWFRLQHGARV